MQHFLSLHNVELIPENSGTENCKFEIVKLENTNAKFSISKQCGIEPENSGIENYRFENAKNATLSTSRQCVIDLRKFGDREQLQENQAL